MSEEIKEKPITPVIFRIWKKTKEEEGGDVIALFPTIKGHDWYCMSYMHVGQHGSADYYGVINRTRPCRNGEELSLKKELEGKGYNLKIYQKKPNLPMKL